MSRRVLHVASELFPYAKTGGLADVVAALPAAQRRLGMDARVLLPGYPHVLDAGHGLTTRWRHPDLFGGGPARVYSGKLGRGELPVFVLDCPGHFMRTGGLYASGSNDWPDNYRRFGALGWVAQHIAQSTEMRFPCDVVHAHDWQGGLSMAYLALAGAPPGRVSTIHNIAYAGTFDLSVAHELALPAETLAMDGVEFYGRLSFLKAGLYYAHKITTVSPTYAQEIQTVQHGGGFDGLLRSRSADLVGVLNGVDYEEWDPSTDRHLIAQYDAQSLEGKVQVKRALRTELGLAEDSDSLLVGVVSRFAWQKGIDLIAPVLAWLAERKAQLVVLGAGDTHVAAELTALAANWPARVVVRVGQEEALAHRIIAGADALLMPSRSEPCGLTQMYALRYGTPPIVRRTGGLADTVRDVGIDGNGTGFVFEAATSDGMRGALARALELFADRTAWAELQVRGMTEEFGWARTARAMAALYSELPAVKRRRSSRPPGGRPGRD